MWRKGERCPARCRRCRTCRCLFYQFGGPCPAPNCQATENNWSSRDVTVWVRRALNQDPDRNPAPPSLTEQLRADIEGWCTTPTDQQPIGAGPHHREIARAIFVDERDADAVAAQRGLDPHHEPFVGFMLDIVMMFAPHFRQSPVVRAEARRFRQRAITDWPADDPDHLREIALALFVNEEAASVVARRFGMRVRSREFRDLVRRILQRLHIPGAGEEP
jgi:hypothetical protein